MAVEFTESVERRILEVHASNHFTEEDYEHLDEATDRLLSRVPSIRVLLILQDFHGWETESLWERRKLTRKHGARLEKMATVGDESLRDLMSSMGHSWTNTEVRFFTTDQIAEARQWIEEA